jgi:hypothetical protein
MDINLEHINRLVSDPKEALNVELKRWIDPTVPAGIVKIVKGALALRNRNGGFLVIGFDDKTLRPAGDAPVDVRTQFRSDDIQQLISKYSSDPFEVAVEFVARDGQEYPVIVIQPGVTVPVAIKSDLTAPGGSLRVGDVPFRTLRANGSFSTAVAKPPDWREIVEICFQNREADIGRFARRHLSGLTPDVLASLGAVLGGATPSPTNTLKDQAAALLDSGLGRYQKLLAARGVAAGAEESATKWGTWEVAMVIDPLIEDAAPTREFDSSTSRCCGLKRASPPSLATYGSGVLAVTAR